MSLGLWSGSTDKSIVVTEMESGSKLQHLKKAHRCDILSERFVLTEQQ